jgi:hypothetical protein
MPSHRGIMWQWEEQPSEDARDGEGQEDGQTGVHQRPDQNLGRGGHQERENRAE